MQTRYNEVLGGWFYFAKSLVRRLWCCNKFQGVILAEFRYWILCNNYVFVQFDATARFNFAHLANPKLAKFGKFVDICTQFPKMSKLSRCDVIWLIWGQSKCLYLLTFLNFFIFGPILYPFIVMLFPCLFHTHSFSWNRYFKCISFHKFHFHCNFKKLV